MKTTRTIFFLGAIVGALLITPSILAGRPALAQTAAPTPAISRLNARPDKPVQRIIIVFDPTWTFADEMPTARPAAWKYINAVATTARDAEVFVIGTGRNNRQATYIKGIRSRRAAKKEFFGAFAGPNEADKGTGTDWVGVLKRAAAYAALNPKPAATHLLVYGDLIADPHKQGSQVVERFERVETWDFSPLGGLTTAQFLYADDEVRLKLMDNPSFLALNVTIRTSMESRARAGEIKPPSRIAPTSGTTSHAPQTPWAMYGIAALIIAGLAIALRRPAVPNRGPRNR